MAPKLGHLKEKFPFIQQTAQVTGMCIIKDNIWFIPIGCILF